MHDNVLSVVEGLAEHLTILRNEDGSQFFDEFRFADKICV